MQIASAQRSQLIRDTSIAEILEKELSFGAQSPFDRDCRFGVFRSLSDCPKRFHSDVDNTWYTWLCLSVLSQPLEKRHPIELLRSRSQSELRSRDPVHYNEREKEIEKADERGNRRTWAPKKKIRKKGHIRREEKRNQKQAEEEFENECPEKKQEMLEVTHVSPCNDRLLATCVPQCKKLSLVNAWIDAHTHHQERLFAPQANKLEGQLETRDANPSRLNQPTKQNTGHMTLPGKSLEI